MSGWIKLHRKIFDNPVVTKDPEYLAVWIYLLTEATHREYPTMFGGKKIMLQPGQLVRGRKQISSATRVSESKVFRILKAFEIDQQIEQQKKPYGTLISIVNWCKYQSDEQPIEQQVNNNRTTSEQQLNTIQEYKNNKNDKNDKNIYSAEITEIIAYLNELTGQHYRTSTKVTRECIIARLKEKFTVDDFKTVIYKKVKEWQGTEQAKFLRPQTLFGTKFESYLQQIDVPKEGRLDWLDELGRVDTEREVDEVSVDEAGVPWR